MALCNSSNNRLENKITNPRKINVCWNSFAKVSKVLLNLNALENMKETLTSPAEHFLKAYYIKMKKKATNRSVKKNTWLHLTRITASKPWGLVTFHLRSL